MFSPPPLARAQLAPPSSQPSSRHSLSYSPLLSPPGGRQPHTLAPGATDLPSNLLGVLLLPRHNKQRIMAASDVRIIPFCVPLSSSSPFGVDGAFTSPPPAADSGFGVVGTITLRGRSAVVWFGWGSIEEENVGGATDAGETGETSHVGNGAYVFCTNHHSAMTSSHM